MICKTMETRCDFGPLLFSMLLERKWRRDRSLNTEKKQILGVSLLTQPAADKPFSRICCHLSAEEEEATG